ncbi:hypothetical protein PRUPE_6G062700 [Prunus persica]|uniref:Uncharacterized protein n=1 Tax=Prunus persica TaxID=3760 RepID=A0A251NL22_PRUPE|nr:hypothetical protein PRUPE_6G062700 [Prunus persica]
MVVILRKVKVRFVQKFFCFSRFMFLVVWPWFLIRSPQRSPQRSDVDNPMNNLHGRRGRTPISGRGHQTIPLHHRTPSYSPPRRSRMYSNHRRHYSRSPSYSSDLSRRSRLPKTYCAQCNRYRPYSYSRSPVRHRYLADSPYDSRGYSPDDSYHVRRYRHGRQSPSPLGARRRSRRSYSHSVSPRPRRSYRRNYPRLSPEPERRTVKNGTPCQNQ